MDSSHDIPAGRGAGRGGRADAAPAGVAWSGQDVLLATKLHVPPPLPGFVPRPRLLAALGEGMARGRVLVCAPAGSGKTALLADWARAGSGSADSMRADGMRADSMRAGRRPVAWLGLDGGDSDPARFWRYAVAALDRARPGLAGRLGPLLGPPPPRSFAGLVTAVINELAGQPGDGDALLVLDDYHLVESGPVHESVAFLLENLPPGLRVVISSRADPPLPLPRLRARGQLAELRAAQLRFTAEEAAALLDVAAGPGLTGTAVAALVARTEGWAAGLQLAALSLRGHADPAGFMTAFSGSHRLVLDYLADEVLDGQTGPVRAFLLETSVLQRLAGELCDAVTGRSGSQEMLQDIERAGLFLVPLDQVRGWWRYHHLFADLLRARLQAEQPERVQALHRAAAVWCDEHDLADDAVRHALAAGDASWAARLVERDVEMLLGRGEGATLRRWLSALPAGSVRDRPRLCLAQAYGAAMGFQPEALAALLDDADRAVAVSNIEHRAEPYQPPGGPAASVLANVPAAIALLRAMLARFRGDAALAAGYNEQALARLDEGDWLMRSFVRWNQAVADWQGGRLEAAERGLAAVLAERRAANEFFAGFLAMRACYDLGEVQRARGNLDAALATYQQALEAAGESGRTAPAGMAQVGLAQIRYERNELTAALDHATQGVTLCRQLAFTTPWATGLAILARIRQALGDTAGAWAAIGEAEQGELSPQVIALLNPVRARLLLAQGDVRAATEWAKAAGLSPDDETDYSREPEYLVLARVLLASNDPGPAASLLRRLLDAAASQGRTGSIIEIQALRALAVAACADPVCADPAGAAGAHARARDAHATALTEAVALASRSGYVRVFADEGAPMHALLAQLSATQPGHQHPARRIDPGYLAALLRACAQQPGQADAVPLQRRTASGPRGLAEPLTERELEVLRLLAAGRSNQRIAHDLVVALDTVKKHVTHILGKLSAANRTEAAARARQLGLIP